MPFNVYFEGEPRPEAYDERLGRGGKGEVYRSVNGDHVVKIFDLEAPDTRQRHLDALRYIVARSQTIQGHPYWAKLFAWPDRVALRAGQHDSLAVRMALVRQKALHNHLERFNNDYAGLAVAERGWWIGFVAIALKLARSITYLDSLDLIHTDISGNNVYGDVFQGLMTLIDCDGAVSRGHSITMAQVGGTLDYMAPELIAGVVLKPDAYTDRHALAVMIYRLLLYRHPLRGPLNFPGDADEAEKRWRGRDALFIDHPTNHANRPQGLVISTTTLGQKMHDLFQRAFVTGLHTPRLRPLPSEWEAALAELYDRIVPCTNPKCPQRFFAAPEEPGELRCSLCKQVSQGPASLLYITLHHYDPGGGGDYVPDHTIVAWPGRVLHEWHLSTDVTPVPRPNRPPYDPRPVVSFAYDAATDHWFICNERVPTMWMNGADTTIPIGETVRLRDNYQVFLGSHNQARMAQVTIRPMTREQPGRAKATLYMLPKLDTTSEQPWPTLNPTDAERKWQPGESIKLQPYTFTMRPSPRRAIPWHNHAAVIGSIVVVGILMAAALPPLVLPPANRLPFAIGLVIALSVLPLMRWLLGSKRMTGIWLLLAFVLLLAAADNAVLHPLLAAIGAGAGVILGIVFDTLYSRRQSVVID